MLDFSTISNILFSENKPHPEYHCDVLDGERFLYGKPNEVCRLGDKCAVKRYGAQYHHDCAQTIVGNNYVCECTKGPSPHYAFYYSSKRRDTICPWCVEHCYE